MKLLKLLAILSLSGLAYATGGAGDSLTVSSGTFKAIDGVTNNNGNFRQAITIGDNTNPQTMAVDSSSAAKVNVGEVGGTTVDTNSGTKSAGTQRVVIATDQPQLTNSLKVDGSGVTQPVSQNTNPWNIFQVGIPTVTFNGSAQPVTQSGTWNVGTVTTLTSITNPVTMTGFPLVPTGVNASTATVRLQDNSGNGITSTTNALDINIKSGSIANTQFNSVILSTPAYNEAQIAGNTLSTGNGTSGTGTQRMNIASDNLPFVINDSTGLFNAANAAVVYVSTFANVASNQTNQILVAGISSTKIRVVGVAMVTGGTATNVTFNTNATAISPLFADAANGGVVLPINNLGWFETNAGDPLTITTGATGSTTGVLVEYLKI